jgi:hypothetical protein
MTGKFSQHGDFTTYVDGRLIISDVNGPWNLELVTNWCTVVHPLAMQMSQSGPSVGIAILHRSLMCPPDAFAQLRAAIIYGARHLGCIGNCIVYDPGIDGAALIDHLFKPVYKDLTPHLFCHDLDQAKAWGRQLLAAQGY